MSMLSLHGTNQAPGRNRYGRSGCHRFVVSGKEGDYRCGRVRSSANSIKPINLLSLAVKVDSKCEMIFLISMR